MDIPTPSRTAVRKVCRLARDASMKTPLSELIRMRDVLEAADDDEADQSIGFVYALIDAKRGLR